MERSKREKAPGYNHATTQKNPPRRGLHGGRTKPTCYPTLFPLLPLLDRFARLFPAGDPLGVMLDVRVTELLCRRSSRAIRGAALVATIGDNQRAFVARQFAREALFNGLKIQSTGDMALFPGVRSVDIQKNHLLFRDRLFQVVMADRRKRLF